MGSAARCGCDPWPPRPWTVTSIVSAEAIIVPSRLVSIPSGSRPEAMCRPNAATGRDPAVSRTPSEIIRSAPP